MSLTGQPNRVGVWTHTLTLKQKQQLRDTLGTSPIFLKTKVRKLPK